MNSKDRAKAIFKNARRYAEASQFLFDNGFSLPNPEFFIPAIVYEVLALELYFKTIYYFDKNKDFKINGKHSHDFYELFKQLSSNIKDDLIKHFKDSLNSPRLEQMKDIKNKTNVTISLDFKNNLKNWSKVFVDIRYIYDRDQSGLKLSFFSEIEKALLQIIYKFQSSWANCPWQNV